MYEEEDFEKTPLKRIIQNFDDIVEPPPDYYQVVAECNTQICQFFPKINIQISSGLSALDTINFDLVKLENPLNLSSKKNRKNTRILSTEDIQNIQNKFLGGVVKDTQYVSNQKFLLVRKKLNIATKELKTLQNDYEEINNHLKFLYNNYKYLVTNPTYNESNKNYKLTEFLNEFSKEFKKLIINFNEKKLDFNYLSQLKEEIFKFSLSRYQIMIAYFIQSRKLSQVNLESLITI